MQIRTMVAAISLLAACSGKDADAPPVDVAPDVPVEVAAQEVIIKTDIKEANVTPDIVPEFPTAETPLPACEGGAGCFGDACVANTDCISGWCVEHMGEKVCTENCQEDCPDGWVCTQIAAALPDVLYICVSNFPNLCRPCAEADDCEGTTGTEDACISYGEGENFCGGQCGEGEKCPWGFSCKEVETVDGATLQQCVNDAGVCPCTDTSVALGLWTPCKNENEFGLCEGQRFCEEKGLSDCDAPVPSAETCDGVDNDCDGEADEPDLVEGEYVGLCDDGNTCTDDACKGEAGCENLPLDGGECMDGDTCTVGDHCVAGECVGDALECDDENPCTDNICTPAGGCEYPPAAGPCDDGDQCTAGDQCQEGDCVGVSLGCECGPEQGCADFEDGDLCNGTLVCDLEVVPYKCVVDPDTVVECAPPEGPNAFCLKSACAPATGECLVEPDHEGFLCEDEDLCHMGGKCEAGVCLPGQEVNCTDGNPCTDDSCDPAVGCAYADNNALCEDGDVCTVGDACAGGACAGGDQIECDDLNACTEDSCAPGGGCVHVPAPGACDDANKCTSGDTCVAGQCTSTGVEDCDDGNACTDDACDPQFGCLYVNNNDGCNDGDSCTIADTCMDGECQPGQFTFDCSDGNPCTIDTCQPGLGCTHEPMGNGVPCPDGLGWTCQEGECEPEGCVPDCVGKECGSDGCDGECGQCPPGQACLNGQCPAPEQQCPDGNDIDWDGCNNGEIVEWQVNTATEFDQHEPDVDTFDDGGFVIVWSHEQKSNSDQIVRGKMFNASGASQYGEMDISELDCPSQAATDWGNMSPRVGGGPEGTFATLWFGWSGNSYHCKLPCGAEDAMLGNWMHPDMVAGDICLASKPYNSDNWVAYPDVAVGTGGDVVGMWCALEGGQPVGAYAGILNLDGPPWVTNFSVSTSPGCNTPAIAALDDGRYVGIWGPIDGNVLGQIIGANGGKEGSEFGIGAGQHNFKSVDGLPGGGFVVAWEITDGSSNGVVVRAFDDVGLPTTQVVQVNTTTEDLQGFPDVAGFDGGEGFVVVWQSRQQDGDEDGVFARRFSTDCTPLGGEFQVNTFAEGNQAEPRVATFVDGSFVVVWESFAQDGSKLGVFAQRFNADGSKKFK